ncbi:hypothetical protein PIB30_094912, partial [Stylosanthes scabra]|nr:hypothetical protein [Stylosanthes scabra]
LEYFAMTDWHSTPLDLNSMHEESQLEEQMEGLNSIDQFGQLDDQTEVNVFQLDEEHVPKVGDDI